MADKPLLEVEGLVVHYETDDGVVKALNGVNIHIGVGETPGPVGETGTGKTTLVKGIMRLIPNPPGKILGGEMIFERQDPLKLSTNGMEAIRGRDIFMVFQGPITSLNPVLTIDEQVMEAIENHNTSLSRQETRKWAESMLERVGTPAERFGEYPHQFSDDMKQGIVVTTALACSPRLLIMDEPTTALDVTMQTQALEIIYKLKSENNASMILIIHDLGMATQNCSYVAIIYTEEVVECGTLWEVCEDTRHPCTEGFFGSIPGLTGNVKWLWTIDGMIPDPTKLPEGCVFYERCRYAVPKCSKDHPRMVTVDGTHQVRCIHYR